MGSTIRRARLRDMIGSLVGFLAVLGTLVIVDPRVWHQMKAMASSGAPNEVRDVGKQLETLADALLIAVREQSIDHAPLLVFSAVAIVLVVVMVRT